MTPAQRWDLAGAVASAYLLIEPWWHKRRVKEITELQDGAIQAGIVTGANEMFKELDAVLPHKYHEAVYQAFWRVYDRRESL